jgi:uncharacterized protein YjaG (DUF416 family)
MYHFDEQEKLATLSRLPPQARVAFATSCASRLAMGYEISQELLKEGDPKILERALEKLWLFAVSGTTADWPTIADQLAELIPDADIGSSFAHAVVDDALAATAYAARTASSGAPQEAAWSARRAYETTDRFAGLSINATEYTDAVEAQILENDVVQQELARQAHDLTELQAVSPANLGGVIETLRHRSSQESTLPLEEVRRQAIMAAAR